MERMEAQIASLAAWVHQVQASPSEPVQRRPSSSRSMSSGHSEGTDTYPGSSASSMLLLPAVLSSLGRGIKWLGVCVGVGGHHKIDRHNKNGWVNNNIECSCQVLKVTLMVIK